MSIDKVQEIERVAMNIVYQIGDELGIKTEVRQTTNDEFIDFAIKLIKPLISQAEARGREEERKMVIVS